MPNCVRDRNSIVLRHLCLALVGLVFSESAHTETLKHQIKSLKALSIPYGATSLTAGGHPVLILRSEYRNDGPWGGDVYAVSGQDGRSWVLARHSSKNHLQSALLETMPHTYEGSFATVRFMALKKDHDSKKLTDLYMLEAKREFVLPASRPSRVTFQLYRLEQGADALGQLQFRSLGVERTAKNWCGVDWALYKIFDVALPEEHPERYRC